MRRAGLVKDGHRFDSGPTTTTSSITPSKAGSEAGDDSGRATGLVSPAGSNLSKDKLTMTREEREAKYKETRDRIFKGFEDVENSDAAANNDAFPGLSRTSSTNGKKRARRQRNTDDGFEARSHYTAYYPAMQYTGPLFDQTPASPAYFPSSMPQQYPTMGDPNGVPPSMCPAAFAPGYHSMPTTPGYPMPVQQQYPLAQSPTATGFNHMQPFSGLMQQLPYQYYQQPQPSSALGQHASAMSSPTLSGNAQLSRPQSQTSDRQWPPQMAYQFQYQQQPNGPQQFYPQQIAPQNPVPGPQTVPYQYGQLPCPPNLPGSRNAHPLPGSYNRQQALNPQIRSFVPGSASQPSFPSSMSQDAALSDQHSNTPENSSDLLRNVPSMPSVHISSVPQFGSFAPTSEPKAQTLRKGQNNAFKNHSPAESTLAKWGTPANLPPKPPPPDPPGMPPSLPQNIPAPPSLPKMSNGQPPPTFQNGVYSVSG